MPNGQENIQYQLFILLALTCSAFPFLLLWSELRAGTECETHSGPDINVIGDSDVHASTYVYQSNSTFIPPCSHVACSANLGDVVVSFLILNQFP
jgi:hypothetical protein